MTVRGVERLREVIERISLLPTNGSDDSVFGRFVEMDEADRDDLVNAVRPLLAVYDAAAKVSTFDLRATQHINGLEHDGHALRAIHVEDCAEMIEAIDRLRSALAQRFTDSLGGSLELGMTTQEITQIRNLLAKLGIALEGLTLVVPEGDGEMFRIDAAEIAACYAIADRALATAVAVVEPSGE